MLDKAVQLPPFSIDSLMHEMASKGDLKGVKDMIEKGSYNPMNKDESGYTALDCAVVSGHLHLVKNFIEELGCNPTEPGLNSWTSLHLAAGTGELSIVKYLLDDQNIEALCYDDFKYTPLYHACVRVFESLAQFCKYNFLNHTSN